MKRSIIVNCQYSQIRVAVLEAGQLVEFYVEQSNREQLVGTIYKGKVMAVRPGIQAAFVDIGLEKNAYLYIDDCLTSEQKKEQKTKPLSIRSIVTEGQEIFVQLIKEPTGTKGAGITTVLGLPGRMLVYMPNDAHIGISRKIESVTEQDRLQSICQRMCNSGEGVVVRTQAEGASEEAVFQELSLLRDKWKEVEQFAKQAKSKHVVYREVDLISSLMRDLLNEEISMCMVDRQAEYQQVLSLLKEIKPQLLQKVSLYKEQQNVFSAYGIEEQLAIALQRQVELESGGYIVIDQTEAMTVIDVNTGKFSGGYGREETVLKTNLEAALEISRQLRLRDIGGIIIIDFIDMHKEANKQTVLHQLRKCLKKDRNKSYVLGFTSLGLLELTRKKVKQNLAERMNISCPHCVGRGMILSSAMVFANLERELVEYAKSRTHEAILVDLHPRVEKEQGAFTGVISELEKEWGIQIFLRGNEKIQDEQYSIAFIGTEEEVKQRLLLPS